MNRSIIRWAGSKKQLLPTIRKHWSDKYKRYVEPFVGSGSLCFDIEPERAILGDINLELVNALRIIRDRPLDLHARLRCYPRKKSFYYALRKRNPSKLKPIARAARFLYLNRYCFNGLYRTNLKGEFNVPYAPNKTGKRASANELLSASVILKTASIHQKDFSHLIAMAKKGDFIYLDPPYHSDSRRIFSEYAAGAFSGIDMPRLVTLLRAASNRGAHFVLSYAYTPEAKLFFKEWATQRVRVKRNIAGFIGDRKGAYELLVTNIN